MKYFLRTFALIVFTASTAQASMSVFGNGSSNTTTADDGIKSRAVYTAPVTNGRANLAVGAGFAQIVGSDGDILKTSAQTNFAAAGEVMMSTYTSLETGAIVSAGLTNTAAGKQYKIQQLHIPAGARLYMTKNFSFGANVIGIIPMGERDANDLQAANIGLGGSMRYLVPASKSMNWVLQLSAARGLFSVGDSGANGAQLRGMMATAGISADL